MKTEIFNSYVDFTAREDKSLNGVSKEFAAAHSDYAEDRGNVGCWNCEYCNDCNDCVGCSYCSYCVGCVGCSYCNDCNGM